MFGQEIGLACDGEEKTISLLNPNAQELNTVSLIKRPSQTQKVLKLKKRISQRNDDRTIDKRHKNKNKEIQIEDPILIENLMQMTIGKSEMNKRKSLGIDIIQLGDQIIWSDVSLDEEDEFENQNQKEEEKVQVLENQDKNLENPLINSVVNYYRQEKYQLQIIDDGNFNNGGVSLQIDFEKKIIKAVKHVKKAEFFQKEIRALQEFQKKSSNEDSVSLKLLDYDTNNLIFSQKAGFISYKQITKIVQMKKLQDNYKLPFEYFILKQLYFLIKKLDTMNNIYKIAHSDIKPNNIVIGFDFIPYFIDLGGAVFIKQEPNEYLTLCTPTFILQRYLEIEQFDEQIIKECEKSSLMLTFLFMLCRNQEQNKLFYQRKYQQLLDELRNFYSQEIIDIFEKSIVKEDQNGIECRVKEILDLNLVTYIENIDQILQFLNELKQFEFFSNQNLYVIKEWDQFNVNILKLFPSLYFEIDLLQITQTQKIYDYFCNQNDLIIFIDINKPFYIDFVNIFLDSTKDCHTLKFEHVQPISIQNKYKVKDVIQKKDGCLTIQFNFGIFNLLKGEGDDICGLNDYNQNIKVPLLKFGSIKKTINSLQIISIQEPLDLKYFNGLNTAFKNCNIQEIKIRCKDININIFQEFLNKQVHLNTFHVHIKEYQYKITFPQLATDNQLRKLKSNFSIINIEQVIENNSKSLQNLEITVNVGEYRSSVYTKLRSLNFLQKISIRVHFIKIPNQIISSSSSASISQMSSMAQISRSGSGSNVGGIQIKKTNQISIINQDFYDFLNIVFSKMGVQIIKLNFSECLVNSKDIVQISRCIKSSINQHSQTSSFPHTLKLNLNVQSKPLDESNTKIILVSLLQSKISRIKVSINNKPLFVNTPIKQSKASFQNSLLNLFTNGYKNDSLRQFSLHLTNQNINIQSIINNLIVCNKYKIIVDGYNNFILWYLENLQFLNEDQTLVLKPSDSQLDSQFKHFSFQNSQITPSFKNKQNDSLKINEVNENLLPKQIRNHQRAESLDLAKQDLLLSNENRIKYLDQVGYSLSEESSPFQSMEQQNQKLDDYIDFKSNKIFSINLQGMSNPHQSKDRLSGLIDCFKLNEQLKVVKLEFNNLSLKKLISPNFIQNLFDSFKYNQSVVDLNIDLSGIRIESLKPLHSCLSFNETLRNISINFSQCDISIECLTDISDGILQNEKITQFKFILLENPQLHYVHNIIHELKNSKPNTDLLLLFNDVRDYNLILSSGIVYYPSESLQTFLIVQKQRKQIKYQYPEFESLEVNGITFSSFCQTGIANRTSNRNQSIQIPNSPQFNHRKYSQQSLLNKQSSNQLSQPLVQQISQSSFSNTNNIMQQLYSQQSQIIQQHQSALPSYNQFNKINSQNQNDLQIQTNNFHIRQYSSSSFTSPVFKPIMNQRQIRKISDNEEHLQNISQLENQKNFNNMTNQSINDNNSEIQSVSTEQNVLKSRGVWISRKISLNKLGQDNATRHRQLTQIGSTFSRKVPHQSTFIDVQSPQSMQNSNNPMTTSSSGQILVYHKIKTNLTLIVEENSNLIALEELAKKSQAIQEIQFVLNSSTINLKYYQQGLKNNSVLQAVSITLCFQPQKSDLKTIIDILKSEQDKIKKLSLNFSRQKIGQENVKIILEHLYQNQQLEDVDLDFSYNMIQPNTAKYFSLFKNSNLKSLSLNLGNNFLGIDGIKYICDLIESNSPLLLSLNLGLDFNFIGNSALQLMQNALAKNTNLQNFNICMKGNQIKGEFASFFDSYLQSHQSIKKYTLLTENCTINP